MSEWLDFTAIQWVCIVFSFVTCAVVTERTLVRAKRDSIEAILGFLRDEGLCNQCLDSEKNRLVRMGYASVETERIMREKSDSTRV